MATISNGLDEGPRPKLHLLDLPPELRYRIYGYIVCGTYLIIPSAGRAPLKQRRSDFRDLSILRVSKCINCEATKVLQRKSWFTYHLPFFARHNQSFDEAPNRHIMNLELIMERSCDHEDLTPFILSFAGTEMLRRTCRILIPDFSRILEGSPWGQTKLAQLRLYSKFFKLLIGFTTVMVQANLSVKKESLRDKNKCEENAKLLMDMIEFSEPALGPATFYKGQEYDMNFKFCPRRFAAERLANAEL